MKKLFAGVILAAAASVAGQVLAHGEKPRHGGIIQAVNHQIFELVSKDGNAVLYVYDHDEKVLTAGMKGKLTVLKGSEKKEFVLEPSGDNTLSSKEAVELTKGSKAVASLTTADKQVINVRFSVK